MGCDICGADDSPPLISAAQMREAVFLNKFDPFLLGLVKTDMWKQFGHNEYENWKILLVAEDESDWGICSKCMAEVRPYLKGQPKPAGINSSKLSKPSQVAKYRLANYKDPSLVKIRDLFFKGEEALHSHDPHQALLYYKQALSLAADAHDSIK